ATFVAVATLGEPIGAALLALALFGQQFQPLQLLGFVVLLAGISVAARGGRATAGAAPAGGGAEAESSGRGVSGARGERGGGEGGRGAEWRVTRPPSPATRCLVTAAAAPAARRAEGGLCDSRRALRAGARRRRGRSCGSAPCGRGRPLAWRGPDRRW